jgi:hypothetical protein
MSVDFSGLLGDISHKICDCGRCYIGKTSRRLEVRNKEHKYNLTQNLFEKSKLAQHAYEEGHKICWNEEGLAD